MIKKDWENRIIIFSQIVVWIIILSIVVFAETGTGFIARSSESGKDSEALSYFEHGMNNLQQKNFRLAITNFQEAISLKPDFHEAFTNLAISHAKIFEYEKAVQILEKCLKQNPKKKYLIYHNMAQFLKNYDQEKAEKIYQIAIDQNPYPKFVYFDLGDFYWEQDRFELAVQNYMEGLKLHNLKDYYKGNLLIQKLAFADSSKKFEQIGKFLTENLSEDSLRTIYDDIVFDHYYLKNNRKIADKYFRIGMHHLNQNKNLVAKWYLEKSVEYWNNNKNPAQQQLKMFGK